MRQLLKITAYIVLAAPILLVAHCVYVEVSQRSGLQQLCDNLAVGAPVNALTDEVANMPYQLRSGGAQGKQDDDWFDREYVRLGDWLTESKQHTDDYTVVFAKPGIGYYVCVILHRDGAVTAAWFEDRSS